jgi:hypothetical protein
MKALGIFACAIFAGATLPCVAQEKPAAGTGAHAALYEAIPSATDEQPAPVSAFVESQARGQLLSSDFMGLAVFDPKGIQLGKIDDVLFDESGKLSVIVLNVSDLAKATKRIAFNLSDLRQLERSGSFQLIVAISPSQIVDAPDFKSLAQEMQLNDGQSLTEEEATGTAESPAAQPTP